MSLMYAKVILSKVTHLIVNSGVHMQSTYHALPTRLQKGRLHFCKHHSCTEALPNL